MKIIILEETENSIEFLVERERGIYNNCNPIATLYPHEVKGITKGQIYQLAWDKVKHIAYRVFNEIEPLDEGENPIGFHFEALPVPPLPDPVIVDEYVDDEKIAMAEAIIDLDARLRKLEGVN